MNAYDSIHILNLMRQLNYKECQTPENADLIVINTCHIREKAVEKVYSELGRIKKIKKPTAIVVLAGCVAQAEGDSVFRRAAFVDFVVGPQNIHKIPELINGKAERSALEFPVVPKFDYLAPDHFPKKPSAFITIQEGCDKFCSYCSVCYTRGPEYSRPVLEILKEALLLAENGIKEITLLGQNVNAYHGLDENGNVCSLGRLISILAKIRDIKQIRYTTSHPSDMHEELYHAHASEAKLMPFIHLPVQSGSDAVLKSMNRKYNAELYLQIIDRLTSANPQIKFSSDIIVGFPGETDQDFEQTMRLAQKIEYAQCFSFKYSPRPGTPGANFNNQIPEDVKQERLEELQKVLNQSQLKFNQKAIGQKLAVLCSGYDEKNPRYFIGKTAYLQTVKFTPSDQNEQATDPNTILYNIAQVYITAARQNSLEGFLV